MSPIQLVVILLAVSAALQVIARRINVPHPVLLVLGGLGLAFVPGLPRFDISPDTLFLVFVPPLLYWAALTTSLRDFRRRIGAIARYGTLVVLLTMTAVAVVAHALIPAFSWPAAFVLGAVIAPPDPVAAIAALRSLGAPHAIVTILEGEGLVNDATALVSYQIAVSAAVAGTFSPANAAWRFVIAAAGGIAIGLGAGWLIANVQKWIIGRFPIVENTLSLLAPFIAYLPSAWLDVSGVLAVVTLGLYLGRRGPRFIGPATRVQAEAMWTLVQFLLESLIFIIIGLELPVVKHALGMYSLPMLIEYCAVITVVAIVVRILYTGTAVAIIRALGARDDAPGWAQATFIGWTGLRGGDSLVIALALPVTTAAAQPFPARDLIIFITFGVILGTLVLQGVTLVPLLRALKLTAEGESDGEDAHARRVAAEAGLCKLDDIARGRDGAAAAELRRRYAIKLKHWQTADARLHVDGDGRRRHATPVDGGIERLATTHRELRRAMIAAEREALIGLRDRGEIGDDVMRRVQREMDLESMMLDSVEDGADPYDEE